MSNELRAHHSARVCGTRHGCRSTAALLSPHYCWYIYRLIIELVCGTIMKQLGEWRALVAGCSATRRLRLGPRRYRVCAFLCVTSRCSRCHRTRSLQILSQKHQSLRAYLLFTLDSNLQRLAGCFSIQFPCSTYSSYYHILSSII